MKGNFGKREKNVVVVVFPTIFSQKTPKQTQQGESFHLKYFIAEGKNFQFATKFE